MKIVYPPYCFHPKYPHTFAHQLSTEFVEAFADDGISKEKAEVRPQNEFLTQISMFYVSLLSNYDDITICILWETLKYKLN